MFCASFIINHLMLNCLRNTCLRKEEKLCTLNKLVWKIFVASVIFIITYTFLTTILLAVMVEDILFYQEIESQGEKQKIKGAHVLIINAYTSIDDCVYLIVMLFQLILLRVFLITKPVSWHIFCFHSFTHAISDSIVFYCRNPSAGVSWGTLLWWKSQAVGRLMLK